LAGWQLKVERSGLGAASLVASTKTYDQIICSAPQALEAAASLKYRDFLTVAVLIKPARRFPITGSTSTILISWPTEFKISPIGHRRWCQIPPSPAWAWSIYASRVKPFEAWQITT
jgi:hypothetical protein